MARNDSDSRSRHHRDFFSAADQRAYIGNGYDRVAQTDGMGGLSREFKYSGKAAPAAAPTVSSSATSGSVDNGIHFVRYRYKDSETGYVSNHSAQATISASGVTALDVPVVALSTSDYSVDKVVIEMTEAGGTEFYEATEVANTTATVEVDITDAALVIKTLNYDALGHDRPYRGKSMAYIKGRMFVGPGVRHTEGKASIASGSATVSFNAADIQEGLVGYRFHVGAAGGDKTFGIASITSATEHGSLVLDSIPTLGPIASASYVAQPTSIAANVIYFSKALYPESFLLTTDWFRVLKNSGDQFAGMVEWKNGLLIFGQRATEFFTWESDPGDLDDARLYPIPGGRGALCQEVIVKRGGVVYSIDTEGIYRFDGEGFTELSGPIRDVFEGLNMTYSERFHAHWDPRENQLVIFVCFGAETKPQTALILNPDGSWDIHYYEKEIVASMLAPDDTGRLRPVVIANKGMLLCTQMGYLDAISPKASGIGTVVSGSTRTSVKVSETLYAAGTKMRWAQCYWKQGAEHVQINTNTADTVTLVSPGFSSAPSVGDTLYFGRINALHRSREFRIGGQQDYQRELDLVVEFEPLAAARTLYCRVYQDRSPAPKADWVAQTAVEGVTFSADNQDIAIDLSTQSGRVAIPLGDVWHHSIVIEFELVSGDIPLVLLGYSIDAELQQLKET